MSAKPLPFRFRMISSSLNFLANVLPPLAGRFAFDLFSTPRYMPSHQRRMPHALASANPLDVHYGSAVLRAWEWGADGSKTVMLVHGWESEATSLASFILPLVDEGYRVIALDGPAHGDSPGKRLNLLGYLAAIRSTIAQHGPVHAVIAHSFGGGAMLFGLTEVNGLGGVQSVVTIGAPSRLDTVLQRFTQTLGLTNRVLSQMFESMRRRFNRSVGEFALTQPMKTPVSLLVVHDRTDAVVPFSDAEEIASSHPEAAILFTEGLGHRAILKNREVIKQVLAFIRPRDTEAWG
jgi:pimeloyl-ACP methyl ester carboxylesterase